MIDEIDSFDEMKFIKSEESKKVKLNLISNYVIQLSDAVQNCSSKDIINSMNLCISYSKNHPIPLNATVISYNFFPILIDLYSSIDEETSKLAAQLLLRITFHPKSEIVNYFIENNYFETILKGVSSIQDQNLFNIILKCIINIVNDFPQAKIIIYSDQDIIDTFFQMIFDNSIPDENIEKIIVIISIISDAEIEFNQKKPILDKSIELLENNMYQQYWPLILSIPESMIISNEVSSNIFLQTKILQICQNFLRSDDQSLLEATIRCIGKYFLYDSNYICIDYRKIMKCAESPSIELSYISLWLLNNALASNSKMISVIEKSGNIYGLLMSFFKNDATLKCKLEACRAMQSIIKQGQKKQVEKAIRSGFICGFIQVIEIEDSIDGMSLAEEIIKTIDFLLNIKVFQMKDPELQKICMEQYDQYCGNEIFENLLDCEFANVQRAAQSFLDKINEKYG